MDNELDGMSCPRCGNDQKLNITATTFVVLTANGVEGTIDGYQWEDDSECSCPKCGHDGVVADFKEDTMCQMIRSILSTPTILFPERMPENFADIVKWVRENVFATADPENWNSSDVMIALRRWMEEER